MEQNSQEYFLIYEGPKDEKKETLIKIKGILIADFELNMSQVAEIINQAPSPICAAKSKKDLQKDMKVLNKAGGKVFILAPDGSKEYQPELKPRNFESMVMEVAQKNNNEEPKDVISEKTIPTEKVESDNEIEFILDKTSVEKKEVKPSIDEKLSSDDVIELDMDASADEVHATQSEFTTQAEVKFEKKNEQNISNEEDSSDENGLTLNFEKQEAISDESPLDKLLKENPPKTQENLSENDKLFDGLSIMGEGSDSGLISSESLVFYEDEGEDLSIDLLTEEIEEPKEAKEVEDVKKEVESLAEEVVEIDLTDEEVKEQKIADAKEHSVKLSDLNSKNRISEVIEIEEVVLNKQEEEISEIKAVGVKRKKGFAKVLEKYSVIFEDIVVPILVGSAVLIAINYYVFQSDLDQKQVTKDNSILLGDAVPEEKVETVDDVTMELKNFSTKNGLISHVKMEILNDKVVESTKITFVGPKPKDLTPEEILIKKTRAPWLKEFIVDDLKVALSDSGILRGMGTGYGYVNHKGKDHAIYANVDLNGMYDKSEKTVQFKIRVDRGSVKLGDNENFKLLSVGRNYTFSFNTSLVLDMHTILPEIDDNGQIVMPKLEKPKLHKSEKAKTNVELKTNDKPVNEDVEQE